MKATLILLVFFMGFLFEILRTPLSNFPFPPPPPPNFQCSILLFELCHDTGFGASSSDEITTSIKSVSA